MGHAKRSTRCMPRTRSGKHSFRPQLVQLRINLLGIQSTFSCNVHCMLSECSTWGERAWEFAVGLILLELYPTSLLYVSIFGLLDAAVVVLFGAAVGAYVDR